MNRTTFSVLAIGFAAVATSSVLGQVTYRLLNHPDGSARPPRYGLRLDELYTSTSGNDIFTFDFDHASSFVTLTVSTNSLVISGTSFGGRDIGNAYADDIDRGLYTFNFTYNTGVALRLPDDDTYVNANNFTNFGSITTPRGDTFQLADVRQNNANGTFRLGNEDNDLGHRGFPGISGWGWLAFRLDTNQPFVRRAGDADDFLFTVSNVIPTPGAAALLGLGGLMIGRRRR